MTANNTDFQVIADLILKRKTTGVPKMNGQNIDPTLIDKILQLADAAPNHGMTEPWRFMVMSGAGLEKFCTDHATMYWEHTPEDKRVEATRDKFAKFSSQASHLILVYKKRSENGKISSQEEYAACCAAVQNILLGADALGLAAIWNTGGMCYKPQMKSYLQLGDEDEVVAFVYLGYSDAVQNKPPRKIALEDKVTYLNA